MLAENLPSHNPYLQAIKISCRHAAALMASRGNDFIVVGAILPQ